MDKKLLNDFDAFRVWFNQNFSLSINGKFKGLLRLSEFKIDWKRFAYRLYKLLGGFYRKPLTSLINMSFHHVSLKLYLR